MYLYLKQKKNCHVYWKRRNQIGLDCSWNKNRRFLCCKLRQNGRQEQSPWLEVFCAWSSTFFRIHMNPEPKTEKWCRLCTLHFFDRRNGAKLRDAIFTLLFALWLWNIDSVSVKFWKLLFFEFERNQNWTRICWQINVTLPFMFWCGSAICWQFRFRKISVKFTLVGLFALLKSGRNESIKKKQWKRGGRDSIKIPYKVDYDDTKVMLRM